MNRTKITLIAIALSCLGLIGVALYLQLVENMLPCPYCVAQRYAFALIALFCLLALALPGSVRRIANACGLLFALAGAGIAGRHLWILANPEVSCGIDYWEIFINKQILAKLLPVVFKSNGLCETPYPPLFGLEIPAWALLWFILFGLALTVLLFQKNPPDSQRELFGKRH